MTQLRLIVWKDVRQLWPQLSAYALLLAMYGWGVPQTWPGSASNSFLAIFVTLLKLLLIASQFVLITSVVHADRLVGEEQFWITRPYDWRTLLGAKLLFVVACVELPLVLMQARLLEAAGLHPWAVKMRVVVSLLRFLLLPCLPMMLVAAVTETLAMAFVFLAGLLVAFAGFEQFALTGTLSRMSPPFEVVVYGGVFSVLVMAMLAYQYARRRTMQCRVAMVATLALLLVVSFGYDRQGFGAPVEELIRSQYATPGGGLRAVFGGPVPYEERGEDLQFLRNFVEVKLPIRLEGLPADARIHRPNVAVAFEAGGVRYAGPWQNASVSESAIGFPLPKDIYDRVAGTDLTLHLELIAEELNVSEMKQVTVEERFAGPMGGNCILSRGKVVCRFAYQAWTPTHVEAVTGSLGCNVAGKPMHVGAWLLEIPQGTTYDPVVNETLSLGGRVCAGDALRFTEYGSPQRFRVAVDAPGVRLSDYRAVDEPGGARP
ncbi:hypothetical protein SAMN05421819_4184 [Bryocella elongata]|uniref:ABC-type transport system involved in multi-copper enzyme maturation, permease component n=1 Tax=Bryocella elongata TaxID=863522 RepID=A0A1H6C281_9BACT|nr:hypothetical protein [Bryocella elongata]SEG67042.1 hypothetical protein SAMN05421819_4184 [Bryocella elongata]